MKKATVVRWKRFKLFLTLLTTLILFVGLVAFLAVVLVKNFEVFKPVLYFGAAVIVAGGLLTWILGPKRTKELQERERYKRYQRKVAWRNTENLFVGRNSALRRN